MKKRILGTLICVMLICVIVASFSFSAFAATDANTDDIDYYSNYTEAGTWFGVTGNYKTDNSRVYVAPERSPTRYSYAQTVTFIKGYATNVTADKNGYVLIKDGERYAIQNTAFQSGDYLEGSGVLVRLFLTPRAGAGVLQGVWSPDWSGSTDGGQVHLV